MTDQEAKKFSSIFSRAKGVMDKVESKPRSVSQPRVNAQPMGMPENNTYASQNNTQPDLDYPVVTEHTDMAGRPIDVQFEIPPEAYLNEEAYATQRPAPMPGGMQAGGGGYVGYNGDVNITQADIAAARGNSVLGPIIEEMARNPLNPSNSAYDAHMGVSVFDRMGGVPEELQRKMHEDAARLGYRTTQQPQAQPAMYQQPAPGYGVQIDYEQIKRIVDEQLKRYATALKKSIIEETKLPIGLPNEIEYLTIGKGSQNIKVVTTEGKIYEVSWKHVGNIKK